MRLFERLAAGLIDPGALGAGAGQRAQWVDVLLLSLTLVASVHVVFWTSSRGREILDVQRQELVERMRGRLPQESLDRLERAPMGYRQTGIGNGFGKAMGLLVSTLLWTAAIHAVLSVALLRSEIPFAAVLMIVSHASLVWVVSELLAIVLMWSDGMPRSGTSLASLLPSVGWPSPATFGGALVSRFDLFEIWWTCVVSIGVARLAGLRVLPVFCAIAGLKLAMLLTAALFFRPRAEGAIAPFGHGF